MTHRAEVDAEPSLRERKRIRTRAAIYEAAMQLFDERVYSEVTVDEICARADVGRATFFRFYGTKAALLLEFNRRLAARVRATIDESKPSRAVDQLRTLAGVIADVWAGSGPSMRAMATEMVNSPEATASGDTLHIEMIELVTAIVADGIERKELNVRNLAPDFIATIVMAALAGSVSKWFQRPKADLHQILRDTIDLILMGLQSSA